MQVQVKKSLEGISIGGAYIEYKCHCGCDLYVCDAQTTAINSKVVTNYFSCARCYDDSTRIASRLSKFRILKAKK